MRWSLCPSYHSSNSKPKKDKKQTNWWSLGCFLTLSLCLRSMAWLLENSAFLDLKMQVEQPDVRWNILVFTHYFIKAVKAQTCYVTESSCSVGICKCDTWTHTGFGDWDADGGDRSTRFTSLQEGRLWEASLKISAKTAISWTVLIKNSYLTHLKQTTNPLAATWWSGICVAAAPAARGCGKREVPCDTSMGLGGKLEFWIKSLRD